MLYIIVDRIYICHIKDVGSLALTGVGVCMPIIMIISAFAALIASITSVRRWSSTFFAALLVFMFAPFRPPFVQGFGYADDHLPFFFR
jgi:hypothetical protein